MTSFNMDELQQEFLRRLGNKIKEERAAKNLSQRQLGVLINKEQKAINRIENAQTNPSVFYLYEIAEGLGVSLSSLLDFEMEDSN